MRGRVQTSANRRPGAGEKRLHKAERTPTIANRSRSGCQLDKLGVTGSSPVPPMENACKSMSSVFVKKTLS
jgi:hypothetical protein